MKKDKTNYGLMLGFWLAVIIPLSLWLIFSWKVALMFFVITQFLLMFCKLLIKIK